MRIAIDFRFTYKNDSTLGMFTLEFWRDITTQHKGHDFFFISNEKSIQKSPSNVLIKALKKTNLKWLDRLRTRNMLTDWKADKLVVLQETGFTVSNNADWKEIKKRILFTGSIFPAGEMVAENSIIKIDPALPHQITSLTWPEAESIKTQYTGGRSFFLFTGDIHEKHQLIELLKAFSMFKKWQQSNMQLVIAGRTTRWSAILDEKISTYKYKEDVVVLEKINNEETAKLVAAAYAMLYPVAGYVFPLALLRAIQSNKAIIATDNDANRQITNAAAWVEPDNTMEGFAKAMILLYKDEQQQQLLVQQTKEQATKFNRQQMLAAVWQCIAE